MEVIVVVCAAFGLSKAEAKTEIMYLRTKGMPESTALFSVEAAGQVYSQTNEFEYLGGKVNHNAHTQRMVQLPEVHPSNCTTDRALPSSSNYGC